MKTSLTIFSNLFYFLLFFSFSSANLLAQPANDRCENATSLMLATTSGSIIYVDGDTRMTEDATAINADYPTVCSGSWYIDDVWFTVSTGATLPTYGLVIQTEVGSTFTDVENIAMAFYKDCNAGSVPIDCFSDAPGRRTLEIPTACLEPNSEYLIRIWSAGNQVSNQGTFRIGTYEADTPFFSSDDIVFWEEDFEAGIGDWTTTTTTDSAEFWRWYAPGDGILNAFGSSDDLTTPRSACTAKMGFPAGWYQTFMTGNPDTIPPDVSNYMPLNSDLISPTIDLSTVNVPVTLKFDQVGRRLNATSLLNHPPMYISFSYDDGVTWADTMEINEKIIANDPFRQTTDKVKLGPAAIGNSTVKIKFTVDMDFYYWIVDNIQLIATEANNMQANSNWYAVAPNALTPRSQLSPIGFMIDVENVGGTEQTNVNLNTTVTNISGEVVYNENLNYGTVPRQSIVENQIMPEYFIPDDTSPDSYLGTYTVSSDSVDFDESNNSVSFRFEVTENTFAREFGDDLVGITPGDANTINWTYGAFYYVPNGSGYLLTDVLFNIENAEQVVGGEVNVTLYKWEDLNDDGIAQPNERGISTTPMGGAIVAYETHIIEAGDTDVTIVLKNWDDDTSPVYLEDSTNYILACAFTSPLGSTTQIALGSTSGDNNNTDYQAMGFIQDSIGLPFYNNFFGSEATFDAELTSGWAWAPRIRMNIERLIWIAVEDALDEANKIEIFPNPASDIISLKLELVDMFDTGILKITDVKGKTLRVQEYANIQNELFTYDVGTFAAGTYFIQFVSEAGTRTERFTIAR